MLVLLSPGQGSQTPGMLQPWLGLPAARDRLAAWSERTGVDLIGLGTTGTAEQVRDTAVAQPLLTAVALLTAEAVLADTVPDAVCGHSVGELSALAVAGVISADDAVLLAATRGAAMAEAAAAAPTGMSAVLGGDPAEVLAAVEAAGLQVATVNVPGQVVVGGSREALDAFAAAPPARSRVRPLDVAGAFHTEAMAAARAALEGAVRSLAPRAAAVRRGRQRRRRGGPGRRPAARPAGRAAHRPGPLRPLPDHARRAGHRPPWWSSHQVARWPGMARRALPDSTVLALTGTDDLPAARALRTEVAA